MSLFGNLLPGTAQQAATTNISQQPTSSLFGQSQPTQSSTPSLFGASTQQNQQPQQQSTPSLFGAPAQQNQQQQQSTPSLFGASAQQQQQQQPQQQNSGGSMFGNNNAQGGSLFSKPAGGLFGQSANDQSQNQNQNQTQQQQQQQRQQQQSQGSVFGNSLQNNANSLSASLLSASTSALPASLLKPTTIGFTAQNIAPPRDKTIPEQMELLLRKWSPDAPECMMQRYFYVSVPPEQAPFITMPPGSDEREWENALRNKPSEGSVPVLAKGFQQLGVRLNMQVEAVKQLQSRLHEMNNSLGAMMQKHELTLSVRAAEAKRRHVGLSQRCLGLAIRAQVLANRGFVLDGAEEELKKKMAVLEKAVFDPAFAGREEEIWARMVAIRERTRWLQEESEKLGRQVSGESGALDEQVLAKTKKILHDYDTQITHLRKEMEAVKKEFDEWEASSKPSK